MLCFTEKAKNNVRPSPPALFDKKTRQTSHQAAQGLITALYLSAECLLRHDLESDSPLGWSAHVNARGALRQADFLWFLLLILLRE